MQVVIFSAGIYVQVLHICYINIQFPNQKLCAYDHLPLPYMNILALVVLQTPILIRSQFLNKSKKKDLNSSTSISKGHVVYLVFR